MTTAPVRQIAHDVTRSAAFTATGTAEGTSDGRNLTGYAAVFGEATTINSWEGFFTETIRAGAFRKSIRESTPVMQFDHGRHPLIGSIPIGSITDLREDEQGLYVEGRLSDNWLMDPLRDAIAEGSVSGMSFRFEVVREEWRDAEGKRLTPDDAMQLLWMPGDRGPLQRDLVEVKVRELGPVVFPAYTGTQVSVRARQVADTYTSDSRKAHEARHSLAVHTAAGTAPSDPALRREVARALLFRDAGPALLTAAETVRLREQIRTTVRLMSQLNTEIRKGVEIHG